MGFERRPHKLGKAGRGGQSGALVVLLKDPDEKRGISRLKRTAPRLGNHLLSGCINICNLELFQVEQQDVQPQKLLPSFSAFFPP